MILGPQITAQDRHPPRRSKAIGYALIALIVFLWAAGLDAIFYPWAFWWMRPVTGAPTLVGTWYGELTTPTGRRQWIALDLEATLQRCSAGCSRIKAEARVCDSRGERRFSGQTRPGNWRGTHFALTVTGAATGSYQIIRMQAERDADGLRVIGNLESVRRTSTGAAVASVSEDRHGNVVRRDAGADTLFPIELSLRRGSERDFEQSCRRLVSALAATGTH